MRRHRFFLNEQGTVFITTAVALFMMTLIAGSVFKFTSQDAFFINRLKKSIQAKYLAEAGLSAAMGSLKSNWTSSATYASVTLAGGSYEASVATASGRTLITSTGTVQGVTRAVTAEVTPAGISAFDYIFAAGGNNQIDSGTANSPGTLTGSVFSGGNMTLDGPSNGGALTIAGNVHATGNLTTTSSVVVTGNQVPNYASTVQFPAITLSYYQTIASANGQYNPGNAVYSDASPIPASVPGGVIYVAGNVVIYGTQNTTASLIVVGNTAIQKVGNTYPKVTITKADSHPALVTMGNVAFQSTGNGGAYLTVTGLLYTGGNFAFQSGNHDSFTLTGSLVSLGNIQITPQSFNILTATHQKPNPPGFNTPSSEFTVESYNQ